MILNYALGLQGRWVETAIVLLVSLLAGAIVLAGIRVSARYAEAMSIAEMIAIVFLAVFFLYESGWHFYNPFNLSFSGNLIEAVLFGLGIPTGYGSIAPLGGEARGTDIVKAAVSVLLFGGLLATFFFYGLGATGFTGDLLSHVVTSFGVPGLAILSFIAISDGVLGGMTYILAGSRTLNAMSEDNVFPAVLSKKYHDRPVIAEAFFAFVFVAALTGLTYTVGIKGAFTFLGALAGLYNLFVHMSANASLIRMALKRGLKKLHEVSVGVIATSISLWVFLNSISNLEKYVVYLFMGWIILGFLYAEGLEIVKSSEEKEKD